MKLQRWIAILLVMMMTLSLLAGCKTTGYDEEEAVAGDYVEGEEYVQSGDKPTKGETSEIIEKDDQNEEPNEDPKDDEEPKDEDPKDDEEPKDEDPKDEDPKDEPSDEEPGDEEIKVEYDPQNLLKIVDYNIRCANDPNGNSIAERAPRLFAFLEKHDPDIIGFQEAVPEWISYIENGTLQYDALIQKYEMRYHWRGADSKECTPLLWKKDKFELLDEGYYWLSETPDEESKGWGAKHYRILNWVKLKVKATGKIFIFINTHLQSSDHGAHSAPLIVDRAKKIGGFIQYPVIITGDFNYAPWSDGYTAFMKEGFLDLNDELGFNNAYTNNGYNNHADTASSNSIKDYIMFGGEKYIVPLKYEVLNEMYYDGWISDHRGLYGEFALV